VSNSILEIIIKFIILLIVLLGFSMISSFFNIDVYQAIAMAIGITLVDFLAFLIRKPRKDKKR